MWSSLSVVTAKELFLDCRTFRTNTHSAVFIISRVLAMKITQCTFPRSNAEPDPRSSNTRFFRVVLHSLLKFQVFFAFPVSLYLHEHWKKKLYIEQAKRSLFFSDAFWGTGGRKKRGRCVWKFSEFKMKKLKVFKRGFGTHRFKSSKQTQIDQFNSISTLEWDHGTRSDMQLDCDKRAS